MINKEIFKKYDVRGKYPADINSETAKLLASAYALQFKPDSVMVGHDTLEGSNAIYEPVCETLTQLGIKVYKCGEISSPMLYFATGHYNISQGIMLTASHLGVGHTGFKIVIDNVPPTPEDMSKMADIALHLADASISIDASAEPAEVVYIEDLVSEYIEQILSIIPNKQNLNRYKVVFDSSNGPNGHLIDEIIVALALNATVINKEIKKADLAHETNPKISKNREQLVAAVKEASADIGIIWDGDADRAYFIASDGSIISPEFVGSILGSFLVSRGIGSTMTLDVRGAKAVEDYVNAAGGTVKRIVAWHPPIKHEMEKDAGVAFGMETSGHYVFRDMYKSDDGLVASILFLAAISDREKDLDDLLSDFRSKYTIYEEINFHTSKSEDELVKILADRYSGGEISKIDGITVDYSDWRFNIRSSKTEPIIRLNISGTNKDAVDSNLELLSEIIGGTRLA